MSTEDRVRVLRVVEYEGPRSWVEGTLARSIHGTFSGGVGCITAVTLDFVPDGVDSALAKVRDIEHVCTPGQRPKVSA